MNLLLDEDLSPEIATQLRAFGIDAVSVHEIGRQGESDRAQLEYATFEKRCLVTRNRNDFILLTRDFFERSRPHAGVLIVPSSFPADRFTRIARAVARYVTDFGDGPTAYLFDYVGGAARD